MYSLLNQRVVRFCDRIIQNVKLREYSTQTAVKIQSDKEKANRDIIKEFEKLSNISIKIRTKKPQKPPFVKNLFLGVFDTDILTYPEIEKDELNDLDEKIKDVTNYFQGISLEQKPLNLSNNFFDNLRQLKLFGLQGPQLLDARELTITENCRFNDVICSSTSVAPTLLYNDLLGIQAFIKKGNEEQKRKYLPQLISGNKLSAFCILERNMKDIASFNTIAKPSSDNKTWIVNGEKSWVINGNLAELLLVIAQTEGLNKLGLKENKLTAFIVDKSFPGISLHPCEPLGINRTDMCNMKFCNTPVPAENILGEINAGDCILSSLLNEFRLNSGVACSALLRKLIDGLVNYCTHTNFSSISIAETDFVKAAVAEITISLYGMESATYLTAGLLDQYENQDCQAESAIVKVFSSENAHNSILKAMELIGAASYMKDHWCNVLHCDALSHLILNEANENLKLSIALLGLQHAGMKIQDKISVIRNPLFNPAAVMKRMWAQRRNVQDNPKLTLNLGYYLHPSLIDTSKVLEYCVLRLEFATEAVLARYGAEVINAHMELKRLAECVIDIYVMTACIGRASRAYCIGLQHADYELLLARAFCYRGMSRVKERVNELYNGPYATADETLRKISGRVFKFGNYFPVHPLTRNF